MTLSKFSKKLVDQDLRSPFLKKMFVIIIFFIKTVTLCIPYIFRKVLKDYCVTNSSLKYLKAQFINIKVELCLANSKKPDSEL